MEPLTTKVTWINGLYHCRLYYLVEVKKELACRLKEDIGYCFAYMLRWFDKEGGFSPMAHASRKRWKKQRAATGKILIIKK